MKELELIASGTVATKVPAHSTIALYDKVVLNLGNLGPEDLENFFPYFPSDGLFVSIAFGSEVCTLELEWDRIWGICKQNDSRAIPM